MEKLQMCIFFVTKFQKFALKICFNFTGTTTVVWLIINDGLSLVPGSPSLLASLWGPFPSSNSCKSPVKRLGFYPAALKGCFKVFLPFIYRFPSHRPISTNQFCLSHPFLQLFLIRKLKGWAKAGEDKTKGKVEENGGTVKTSV